MPDPAAISAAADALARARAITVMTGAGVSAESGVPTFRGAGGHWRGHDAMRLATPEGFAEDPQLVWEWYDHRRALVAQCSPNAAHLALVRLEARTPDFLLATQNVDGLHQLAGSRRIVALHGDLFTVRCTICDHERPDRTHGWTSLPRCPRCGGLERPGVVWFGEALPDGAIDQVADAVSRCEVFLVVGTSGVVWPAAGFAEMARRLGRAVIVVNLEPTAQDPLATWALHGPAGEILPRLVEG
jgi:NAD-dependent deacetylase